MQIKGQTSPRSKEKDTWELIPVNRNPWGFRKYLYSETPKDTQRNLSFPKTELTLPQAENKNN